MPKIPTVVEVAVADDVQTVRQPGDSAIAAALYGITHTARLEIIIRTSEASKD